ncbi:MAG: DUF488 domain-containing protein [Desulfobacterales bacterium]|nr:DUF488 domain-containing protein [Desulfobacterales bacterium]
MNDNQLQGKLTIFTVGHSNHSLEVFINLLQSHKIEVLVDVRSKPFSRFSPQFNKGGFEKALKASGIKYLFLGRELGGRPQGSKFYDNQGFVLYSRIAESPLFLEGIDRLIKGIKNYRVAVMCSEENPANCHRQLLVGRVLAKRGVSVRHIRGDGTVQDEDELAQEAYQSKGEQAQLSFFEPKEEVPEWKSTQSVLPRKKLDSSSAH